MGGAHLKEKAELFASVLTDTFTDAGSSSDFDLNFNSYVEEFVAKFDYKLENSPYWSHEPAYKMTYDFWLDIR